MTQIKVGKVQPGDVVRTQWGEDKRVVRVHEAHPGRGIRGRATYLYWDDDTASGYTPGTVIEVLNR
jgi:hypothetical protein